MKPTTAIYEQVTRNSQVCNLREVGMVVRIQVIGEKRLDTTATVFSGREGDAVNDDNLRLTTIRPFVTVR